MSWSAVLSVGKIDTVKILLITQLRAVIYCCWFCNFWFIPQRVEIMSELIYVKCEWIVVETSCYRDMVETGCCRDIVSSDCCRGESILKEFKPMVEREFVWLLPAG